MKTKLKGGSKWVLVITAALLCAMVFSGCSGEEAANKNTVEQQQLTENNDANNLQGEAPVLVKPDFDEEKRYSEATLEDDFVGGKVVVILNKAASLNFKKYTPEDFPEIDCVMVTDSSSSAMENVRLQLEALETGNNSKIQEYIDKGLLVNIDNFRRILDLQLSIQSKEYVLQAIKLLEKRNDLMYAGPVYKMGLGLPVSKK